MPVLRVLLVDDREDAGELVARELRRSGFDPVVKRVTSGPDFAEALQTDPQVIIADHDFAPFGALAALAELRRRGLTVPLVVVAVAAGLEVVVECMRAGAAGFVVRDHFESLGPALKRALAPGPLAGASAATHPTTGADVPLVPQPEAKTLRLQRLESLAGLANGVAHDLNNVLTPMLMAVQFLSEACPGEPERSMLKTLEVSALRGANVVKQMLSFNRCLEGAQVVLQPRYVLKELGRIAEESFPKNIPVHVDYPSNLWSTTGDVSQIQQVLWALCLRGREAMPYGGSLNLKAENRVLDEAFAAMHPDARPGRYVAVTIADTGAGLSAEALSKLFDPPPPSERPAARSGLDLSACLGVVRQHGGFVQTWSEPGKGSRVKLFLPAVPAEDPEPLHEKWGELPSGHGELVLIVDDDMAVREVARNTLERHGYRVLLANDGTDCSVSFAQHKDQIQAVLMDLMMPYMDGVPTIRSLRRLNPTVPIIATSGMMNPEEATRMVTVEEILRKPFTGQDLLLAFGRVFARQTRST